MVATGKVMADNEEGPEIDELTGRRIDFGGGPDDHAQLPVLSVLTWVSTPKFNSARKPLMMKSRSWSPTFLTTVSISMNNG